MCRKLVLIAKGYPALREISMFVCLSYFPSSWKRFRFFFRLTLLSFSVSVTIATNASSTIHDVMLTSSNGTAVLSHHPSMSNRPRLLASCHELNPATFFQIRSMMKLKLVSSSLSLIIRFLLFHLLLLLFPAFKKLGNSRLASLINLALQIDALFGRFVCCFWGFPRFYASFVKIVNNLICMDVGTFEQFD